LPDFQSKQGYQRLDTDVKQFTFQEGTRYPLLAVMNQDFRTVGERFAGGVKWAEAETLGNVCQIVEKWALSMTRMTFKYNL
jgi:hypothetical protein